MGIAQLVLSVVCLLEHKTLLCSYSEASVIAIHFINPMQCVAKSTVSRRMGVKANDELHVSVVPRPHAIFSLRLEKMHHASRYRSRLWPVT